jgi:1-acyl-sn-glycerol-3-phosphate acyltransferase
MVTAELKRQCALQGFNEQAFAPFFEMIQTTYEPQSSSYFDPIISLLNDTYIMNDEKTGKVQVVSYVQTDDEQTVKKVVNDAGSASSFAFSQQDVSNQLVRVLSDSFNYIGFVCGFVVFFFLWISFGSIELSLMSFLPLAVGWVWILGLMHLLGIQFNIVNIILATFIFGQGDDYTIFITEGLLYEYTTGKKRLASYKRSVALSAILMFIGIGTLIFAKHPALRSLAEVTIVGMFTVVLMAYYLPPMVFRWLTRGTQAPEVSSLSSKTITQPLPITLGRFFRSLFSIVFFLLMMYLFMLPFTWLYFHIGKNTEEKKLKYHRLLQKVSNFVIHRVPGVKFYMENRVGETFEKPAVVICNHQSHLDLMCLMMLTPRIVFLTNDWVWHNPFYGLVIHQAEFYPVSDGIEAHVDQLRSLYERGYSIAVFPEGTRSVDCSIQRFHKGAFYLAEQLQADILPIVLHGAGHVLPKKDFMLREGRIDMEVLERIRLDDPRFSSDLLTRTKQMRAYFKEHYAGMCERIETEDYWKSYQRYIEKYKI